MKSIEKIEINRNQEELLPGFASDFPYIAMRAKLDNYTEKLVPWHWHRPIEMFYMESGTLEYYTPKEKIIFPAGSGGVVNSNILHMTKALSKTEKNVQLLHIFDPVLIAGIEGSRIDKKYVMPLVTAPQLEILPLFPNKPVEKDILQKISDTFRISEQDIGYEIKLRESLSAIWLMLFDLLQNRIDGERKKDKNDERLKMMLVYIHEHFTEKIAISELAVAGYLSERACFRLFRNYLRTTPTEYIKNYRLQEACRLLTNGQESVTDIGYRCGFGNGSYFGKVFLSYFGMTPTEYRNKWQDSTK